jgi:hypothetical protein
MIHDKNNKAEKEPKSVFFGVPRNDHKSPL